MSRILVSKLRSKVLRKREDVEAVVFAVKGNAQTCRTEKKGKAGLDMGWQKRVYMREFARKFDRRR